MGNAAPVSSKSKSTADKHSKPTKLKVEVGLASRRSSQSSLEKKIILDEFPDLKDTLTYLGVAVKAILKYVDDDAVRKNMNLSVKKSLDDIYSCYFEFKNPKHRQMIGDKLAAVGAASIFAEYMKILTNHGNDYPTEGHKYQCFEILRGVCWNFTDVSTKLGEELGKVGMLPLMLHDLQKFQHSFKENSVEHFVVLSAMSILHNCAGSSENAKYFKAMNAVEVVAWYAKNAADKTETILGPLSSMTLALIVDDKNNDVIVADQMVINTILQLLIQSLTSKDHRCDGFSATELTFGLTRLANNEENSVIIVQNGILESLMKMLSKGSEEEKVIAAKAMWALAFSDKNKPILYSDKEILSELRKLAQPGPNQHVSRKLKQAAEGALWVLEQSSTSSLASVDIFSSFKKSKKKNVSTVTRVSANETIPSHDHEETTEAESSKKQEQEVPNYGHIMISYQWDCQKLMIRVKEILESKGYKIWLDVDGMGGSTLQSMAEAVEKAAVILICLSQKYKESISCRTEAEYAYKLSKPVIPLRIEQDYTPDGWLGAIVGAKLYFDFSISTNIETITSNLIKEIGERGKLNYSEANADTNLPLTTIPKAITVNNWTSTDVTMWSRKNNITSRKVQKLEGKSLMFLKKLKNEAPEFFYRFINSQLGLKDIDDLINFTNALADIK